MPSFLKTEYCGALVSLVFSFILFRIISSHPEREPMVSAAAMEVEQSDNNNKEQRSSSDNDDGRADDDDRQQEVRQEAQQQQVKPMGMEPPQQQEGVVLVNYDAGQNKRAKLEVRLIFISMER